MIYTVPAFFTEVFHIFQYLHKNFREIFFEIICPFRRKRSRTSTRWGKRKGPAITGLFQYGVDIGADGTLPIGSRHMNKPGAFSGSSQIFIKPSGILRCVFFVNFGI